MKSDYGAYIDEHGTKTYIEVAEDDKRVTDTLNSSKTLKELKRQNDLYEKELHQTKGLVIAGIVISLGSFILQIVSYCK